MIDGENNLANFSHFTLNSKNYKNNELRLDASFYSQRTVKASNILENCGFPLKKVGELTERPIFMMGRVKRHLISNGLPFLMPSELFEFIIKPTKHIAGKQIEHIEEWYVKEGWLLLTRSGRAGLPLYVTKSVEDYVISDDVLRIVTSNNLLSGYMYAFFSTWIGKALLSKDPYGSTVEHLEPHHVESLLIPVIPEPLQEIIATKILQAFNMRENARKIIIDSEKKLYGELGIEKDEVDSKQSAMAMEKKISDIGLRFDVSYHLPHLDKFFSKLKECKYRTKQLGDRNVTQDIFIPPRFKRIFVERDYGVPYLLPSSISQIKSNEQKYISKMATKDIDNFLLKKGWVIVTTDGTVGRTAIATASFDGWFGSNNIARLIPSLKKMNVGYMALFLMSALGQCQILREIYGAVVDHIEKKHLENIIIPVPPLNVQEEIGIDVLNAFELRDTANKLEMDAIEDLENLLEGKKAPGQIT